MNKPISYANARQIFRQHSGVLRTAKAIAQGIPPATLYAMRDAGIIVRESRGLYRLAEVELTTYPDLVQVCQRVPKAVICLISALDFHDLTTQMPRQITIALPRGERKPKLDYPHIQVVHMAKPAYAAGIEMHDADGLPIRVYSPEKTIADIIKFRNTVGIDLVQESLRLYLGRPSVQLVKLLQFAQINRVEGLLRRYLEVLV